MFYHIHKIIYLQALFHGGAEQYDYKNVSKNYVYL